MAKVKLHRVSNNTGEAEVSSSIHFFGMNYPIHFDKNGFAMVDEDDYLDWIVDHMAPHGIHLVEAAKKAAPRKKAAPKNG